MRPDLAIAVVIALGFVALAGKRIIMRRLARRPRYPLIPADDRRLPAAIILSIFVALSLASFGLMMVLPERWFWAAMLLAILNTMWWPPLCLYLHTKNPAK